MSTRYKKPYTDGELIIDVFPVNSGKGSIVTVKSVHIDGDGRLAFRELDNMRFWLWSDDLEALKAMQAVVVRSFPKTV